MDPEFIPKDDVSMAKYLAKKYEANGVSPDFAIDQDALDDFGGPGAFIP